MKYLKTNFRITTADESLMQVARELLADMTSEVGYESFMDTEDGVEGYIQQGAYDGKAVDEVLADFPLEGVSIDFATETIEDQDWNETWETEQGFEPICIDKHLVVYDALHTDPSQLDNTYSIEIGIRARNAFGTGTHETTRMMVSTIMSLPMEGKRVLDCGCGTGILAIAALKCGAAEAVGYDIDEWSVENSRYNATLNGVGEQLSVYEGDANVLSHVSGVFDVVLANINRNILLADMEMFVEMMDGGAVLALSGFYGEDVPLLMEKAGALGLELISQRSENEWNCLLLQMKKVII